MSQAFDPNGELVVVPAEVVGPKGRGIAYLALDTGATLSLINRDFLLALGYDPGKAKEKVHITTGSGEEYVPYVQVKIVDSLGKRRKNFSFLCHNLPPSATVDGLIGLDFFRKRRLVLDFRKGRVSLT